MNTHNDFLDNAVNDELEMECIGDLTTDVCLSLQNATCGDGSLDVTSGQINAPKKV